MVVERIICMKTAGIFPMACEKHLVIHYRKIKKPLPKKAAKLLILFGGDERDRTADLYVAKVTCPQRIVFIGGHRGLKSVTETSNDQKIIIT